MESGNNDIIPIKKEHEDADSDITDQSVVEEAEKETADVEKKTDLDKSEERVVEKSEKESDDAHGKNDSSFVDGNDGAQNSPKTIISAQRRRSFGEKHVKKDIKMEIVGSKESEKGPKVEKLRPKVTSFNDKLHCDSPGCTREFSSEIVLSLHKRKSHSKEFTNVNTEVKEEIKKGSMFPCDFPECDREFPSKTSLSIHKRIHAKEKEVKKEVKEDSKAVISSNEEEEKEERSYSQEILLSDDKTEKEDKNVSNVQCCPNCSKFYKNKFYLSHFDKCREPRKASHCIKCGEVFASVELLKEHFDSEKCCEEKTDPEDESDLSVNEHSNEEVIQVEPPRKRPRMAKKEPRKMTSVPKSVAKLYSSDEDQPSSEDESDTAISLLEGENIEKSPFALLWTVVSTRAKIHKNEMMIIWSDKFDGSHLNVINGYYNVVFCFKSVCPLQLAAEHTYALKQTSLLTFLLQDDSEVTFSQWTVITFNKQNDLADIDSKVFKNLADVETKLAEFADKNEMSLMNVVAFSENDFFTRLVKKLTKKILVFNCPE